MAIQFIDNQPLSFLDNLPTGGECLLGQQEYCVKYDKGDTIYAQWKITPCNPINLICNPTFANNQPEGVIDPYMSNGFTDWTGGLLHWTYDFINFRWQALGNTNTINNYLAGDLNGNVSSGYVCEVEFTIGGMTGGTVTPNLGGTLGTPVYLPGTYKQLILHGGAYNQIRFVDLSFDGWIDNVSVKISLLDNSLQDSCWASTGHAERWNINSNGCISKIPGTGDVIFNEIYAYTSGMYVKFTCNVSNLNNGQIQVKNNGSTLFVIDQNGLYEKYFYMYAPLLEFSADALFDGTLCGLSLVEYGQNASISMQSISGGPTYDFTSSLTYFEDTIIFNRFINTGIANGCYIICLSYECSVVSELSYVRDPLLRNEGEWKFAEVNQECTLVTYGNGQLTVNMCPGTTPEFILTDDTFAITTQQLTQFNYSISIGNDTNSNSQITIEFPGCPQTFLITNSAQPNTTYSGTFVLPCQPNAYGPIVRVYTPSIGDECVRITFNKIEINYLLVNEPVENTFCSNCLNIQQHHYCSLFIGGYCGEDSFGFKFPVIQSYPWRIGARVKAVMINPKYNGELKRYADSQGNIKVTKANSNKIYELLIDYVDELSHDWLRVAFLCDTIEIGVTNLSGDYFVGTDGDYEPEWPSNLGNFNLAQSRVNLQRKTDVIYNNNAG